MTLPQATLDTPFGDGILNGTEAGQDQTLTGSTGVTTPGQTVTITLGAKPTPAPSMAAATGA
ncbi:hypothetical protein ACQ86O_27135 (plasmid) [Serratia sp. L9]|uniref:hypothetical protein n=1 Tax=Serratia sp. L9 TaxID=3423946 RepID=UPI003D673C4F